MTSVFIIAGEASGDVLGARLMAAMPGVVFAGIGGERMAERGLVSLFPMAELSVMGLAEILPRVLALRRRIAETVEAIRVGRPDVVVTIDSPGFCLRVLRRVAGFGVRRVHYVAPQVWAWRPERVRHFPGLWDKLLCLLPFEPEFFAPWGLNPVFVGHPVLESGAGDGDAARFRAVHGLAAAEIPVVLMPGSRVTETARLLPVFRQTMALLGAEVLCYPTAIGSEPYDAGLDTSRMWRRAMQGHAVSNCLPVIAANRIGSETMPGGVAQSFYGHSFIADEWGDLVAEYGARETGVLTATLDLARAAAHRAGMGFFRDRRPQLYGSLCADG